MGKHTFWIALLLTTSVSATAVPDRAGTTLLKATDQEAQAAVWATRFLTRFHYKTLPLDDAMSAMIFDRYLDALDAERVFFLSTDVDGFKSERTKLDDAIYDQDLSTPFAIFNLYKQRITERTAYARGLLKAGFDFSKDETYVYEREKAPWAKSVAELNDVWRKRVKNDWLRLKLAGKDDAKIRETLDKRYANYFDRVRQLNSEDVFQTFMNAYATAIEPHTNYLGPRASENFDIAMKLSLEGIGAVLQRDDEYTAIREIVPGGPAALSSKVKVGDRIVGVGQGESGPITDVLGWRLDDVVELIRGPKDSVVRLDILPADAGQDGKHTLLALTRKKVSIEESAAKSSIIDIKDGVDTRHVGVITLPGFYQDFDARRRGDKDYKSATRDVAKLLAQFKKQNVDGVLVDLRNNGGGSLTEATELTGLFIDKGPVVQVRNAQGKVEEDEDSAPGMAWEGPLALLVNRNSASASEIFAAAIQDYGRGLIIGEPTYGKGTVQNLVDLDQVAQSEKPVFGELKMTIAQFFRINGGTTQLRGVTPDINFPVTADFEKNGEQANENALPWTSIEAAHYKPVADLKDLIGLLETRHDARIAKDSDWRSFQEDIAEYRRLRKETTLSLNEQVRRKERDQQEARRLARDKTKPASVKTETNDNGSKDSAVKRSSVDSPDAPKTRIQPDATNESALGKADLNRGGIDSDNAPIKGAARGDDGLQADERGLKTELAQEQEQKQAKDVLLNEALHILVDEIGLIHADTKLAARVLPHTSPLSKDDALN